MQSFFIRHPPFSSSHLTFHGGYSEIEFHVHHWPFFARVAPYRATSGLGLLRARDTCPLSNSSLECLYPFVLITPAVSPCNMSSKGQHLCLGLAAHVCLPFPCSLDMQFVHIATSLALWHMQSDAKPFTCFLAHAVHTFCLSLALWHMHGVHIDMPPAPCYMQLRRLCLSLALLAHAGRMSCAFLSSFLHMQPFLHIRMHLCGLPFCLSGKTPHSDHGAPFCRPRFGLPRRGPRLTCTLSKPFLPSYPPRMARCPRSGVLRRRGCPTRCTSKPRHVPCMCPNVHVPSNAAQSNCIGQTQAGACTASPLSPHAESVLVPIWSTCLSRIPCWHSYLLGISLCFLYTKLCRYNA